MKIKMLASAKGHDVDSEGVRTPIKYFTKDGEYEVGESLGKAFVSVGAAKDLESSAAPQSQPSVNDDAAKAENKKLSYANKKGR